MNVYSQSLELNLILQKDTIEALEPIPYAIEFIYHSDSNSIVSIADNKQGKFGTSLEFREKGTELWKTLWLSGMERTKLCLVEPRTPNPNPIYGFNHQPQIPIVANTIHKKTTSYFPYWRYIFKRPFQENTTYEIRLKMIYYGIQSMIYSQPKDIFIKQYNIANQQFLTDFINAKFGTLDLFPPWWQCGMDIYNKVKFNQLKKNHPDSDLSDWIIYQEQEYNLIRLKNKVDPKVLDYTLSETKSHLYKMIYKDFFPKSELINTLQNIISYEFTLHKNKEAYYFESLFLKTLSFRN